jgi:hypothetical protein
VELYIPSNADLNLTENFGNWRVPDAGYLSHLESPSNLDAGGRNFMITARLHAISALKCGNEKKLLRVLDVLARYAEMPCAMDPVLMGRLRSRVGSHECSEAEVCIRPIKHGQEVANA